MKKLLVLILMSLVSAVVFAQGEELMKLVPAEVDGFAYVDMKELSAHPKFKETVEANQDPQFTQFKNDLSQSGIDIYQAFSNGIMFFSSKNKKTGGFLKTKVDEATFSKMLDNRAQGATPVKKTAVDGKTFYIFENGDKKTALVYLKPDTIGIVDHPDDASKFFADAEKTNVTTNSKLMGYVAKADKKSPLWAVFQAEIKMPSSKGADGNPAQQLFPFDNIQGGFMDVNFSGETKDTVNLNLRLNCKEKMKAQILTMQMQGLFVMYIPAIAKGNQSLTGQITKAISFANEENDIVIKAKIDPALQEELNKMIESNQLNFNDLQMPAPGPKKKKSTKKPAPSEDVPGLTQPPKGQ